MTQRQINIQYLIRSYLFKHKDDEKKIEALRKIQWYSLPVVYPDWNDEVKIITREMGRRKSKKKRTRHYLQGMTECYEKLYFITLTFRDIVFETTCDDTRRRYARRFLEEHTRDYFANIDYGKLNGREHFHAVVAMPYGFEGDLKAVREALPWKYGAINIKSLRGSKGDVSRVATYVNKLTNHANKVGTGKSMHKRGYKSIDDSMDLPF